MIYTSINNELIKNIKKLQTKKYRDKFDKFLVEGEHLVNEAIKSGFVDFVIVLENYSIDANVRVINVSENILKYLSELENPQKVMAVCKKNKNKQYGNKIMILDGIQDPGNLGTIIRSCVAFDCDTLVLSKDTVDLYNSKVIRATQGMIFKINIIVTDLESFILKLKDYTIIGTDVNNGNLISEFKKDEKFAIIMGNEGNGISKKVKALCTKNIYIPMNKDCESLNVGVAASIILYELR